MRLVRTKTQRPEGRCQECRVELAFGIRFCIRQHLAVKHVLKHEQPCNVRLGLFDGAIQLPQLLARRAFTPVHAHSVGSYSVSQLVSEDVSKERVKAEV